MDDRIGLTHLERKRLFMKGFRERVLTVEEIETSLPPGSLSAMERWLFYYSLRAAEIDVRGEQPGTGERSSSRAKGH